MKQRVAFSKFCIISTLACLALFVWTIFIIPEIWWQIFWGGFIAILLIISFYYMPLSIAIDEQYIYVNRGFNAKKIPLSDVKTVRLCPPTMGAIRICGSGGFLGYWGWFSERDLGKYFAYYGKSSDCFLVELNNGNIYILGCKNAPQIAKHITQQLQNP